MNIYRINIGYRTDDGLNYSMSTHFDTLEVEAESVADARLAAIDMAYEKHGNISHVIIRHVEKADN